MKRYNPKEIEPKWQAVWEKSGIYNASEDPAKPKRYILEYFPYPSGAAMHVGHVRNYTIGDVMSRHARMNGFNVLHPMGWDAFGLPAENYAIKTGISPQQAIEENTQKFKTQLTRMGFSYDWSREFASSDPEYYRWTQWFFLLLYKRGLAYRQESLQWWCPNDKTVLANEQVENGRCWRCGFEVEKKSLKQWFFKITDYADRLAKDLDDVDWSESIKSMQRNWIGRSTGAEIEFIIGDDAPAIKDTLKFTPHLTNMIQAGEKWSTFRLEPKNISVGDYVKLLTRFDIDDVKPFAIARIKSVMTAKLKDISNNHPGHETYQSDEEKLVAYQGYYGDQITFDTKFTVYEFEKTNDILSVFTTRADTLFGATFMVLAPEHPLLDIIVPAEHRQQVENYREKVRAKSDIERQETNREKTGVFTGAYAINPANDHKIPIWTADYVLMGYGTGAIMGVPAHDERDYAFAKAFGLPIKEVVAPDFGTPLPDVVDVTGPVVIGYDPNVKQFMSLINTKNNMRWFAAGGLEDGETYEQAAIRELAEEAGFHEVKKLIRLGGPNYSYFYNSNKNSNRRSFSYMFLAIIDSTEEVKQELEAHEAYKVVWSDLDAILRDMQKEPQGRGHWIDGLGRVKGAVVAYDQGKEYESPIITAEGVLFESGIYSGLSSAEARERIVADLEAKGAAQEKVNYRMRDWLISRQRYWGAPIPMIHCPKDGIVPVPEDQLPVVLPELTKFEPSGDGRSPLANVPEFVNTTCPTCGGAAQRETDTMDGFACSSWYFLRFADPHNNKKPFNDSKVKFWLPVDDYIGGAEHAVMHLLYARMWTKVMQDAGLVDFSEPFKKLRNQGMILAPDGQKMSKSKGNTIQPDELIDQGYGADSIRIMELFIGPWNQSANWSVEGMGGSYRFLQRIWTLVQELTDTTHQKKTSSENTELQKIIHRTIKKVSDDLHAMSFNTAVAAMMECVNDLYKLKVEVAYADNYDAWHTALSVLLQLVAPFAPHMAEELWQQLGHGDSIHVDHWPKYEEKYITEDTATIAVQINGKLRGTITAPAGADQQAITQLAQADAKIAANLTGKTVVKVVYVADRLLNFVVK